MTRIALLLLAALSGGVPRALAEPTPAPTTARAVERLRRLNLESFDVVWRTVKEQHYDPTLGGLDWDAVRDELRPKIERAGTLPEARAILRDMLSRLKQTHFEIMAPDGYQEDDPSSEGGRDGHAGIDARVLGGRMLVTRVEPGSSADKLGVKTGWEIRAIDGVELAPQIERVAREHARSTLLDSKLAWLAAAHLSGKIGERARVRFMDGGGAAHDVDVPFAQRPGIKVRWSTLPPRYVHFEHRLIGRDVSYVRFNTWLDALNFVKFVDGAMTELADARGLVIDLRGARGGLGHLPVYFASLLIDEPGKSLGVMRTRATTYRLAVPPREGAFGGRVAILTDGLTRSAGEIFTAGLQDLGRARVFGQRTAGAVLPARLLRLPNGDTFEYVIASHTTPNGRVLEGNGVTPDVEIVPTREQLLAGRDPVLEAALEWVRSPRD